MRALACCRFVDAIVSDDRRDIQVRLQLSEQ
jgi:hypothetical protein